MSNSIFNHANDLIKQKQYQQAIDILNPLFIDHSDEPQLWWLSAKANAPLNKEKALFALTKCLILKPDSIQVQRAIQQLGGNPDTLVPSSVELAKSTLSQPIQSVDNTATTAITNKVINNTATTAITNKVINNTATTAITNKVINNTVNSSSSAVSSSISSSSSQPRETSTSTSDQPSITDAASSGFFAFLAAIPVGAYVGATIIVIEIIVGFLSMVIHDLSATSDLVGFVFSAFIWIIGLIPLVIVGVVGAIGGAIFGGLIGGVVGFINMIILTVGSIIHPKVAYLASLVGSSVFAVWIYNEFVIEEARKIADTMFAPWIADINYVVVVLVGLLISVISLGGMLGDSEGASDDDHKSDKTDEEIDEELKAVGDALLAPWKLFGKAAKGSLKAGGVAVSVGATVINPQLNDNYKHNLDWDKSNDILRKMEQERKKAEDEKRKAEYKLAESVKNWKGAKKPYR